MSQLMNDIMETANSFAENFKEEQPILVAGEPDFSVAIKAWEKVKGRLENGVEDNIPFYIEGYREHVEQGKNQKGYTAIVV